MRRTVSLLAGMGMAALLALPAAAQVPGAGLPARPGMAAALRAPGAEWLLASTGALHLTDQQVTRLAAIARRATARREALRASFDSTARLRRAAGPRPDSVARRLGATRAGAMEQAFRQAREQEHADLRDALAVLTPDQLAQAWEMISRRGMVVGRAAAQLRQGRAPMRNGQFQRMRQLRPGMAPPPAGPGPTQP